VFHPQNVESKTSEVNKAYHAPRLAIVAQNRVNIRHAYRPVPGCLL